MKPIILVVDDEADLLDILQYNLEKEGYQVLTAISAAAASAQLARDPVPDLVVLDLMLPDSPGTAICRSIRAEPRTADIPVLMLTAKGEEIDRVVGFEVGADDYVVKPFSVRELMLRIKVMLRRRQTAAAPVPRGKDVRFGALRIDVDGHRVWVEDEEIPLTALEFQLLLTLHARRGRVQTRETLLSDVWSIHADVTTRTVDTHIKRLREKLRAAGHFIETVRGVGYRFRTHPDEAKE
ncbi:MAG: response regulator transcription factor [Myxococcota bacterium]|jgi:two-component system phosphate regulon response regulator PhoB|nr:response regulator transcription factor [Myxococcota bacterium]